MREPIVLYSTNTLLAYRIAERFYNQTHYVWCVPNDTRSHPSTHEPVPPTSNPIKIYKSLLQSIAGNDRHCPKIAQNRLGLLHGAEQRFANKEINEHQLEEIISAINDAPLGEFHPVFYVIPYQMVRDRVIHPHVNERASVLSPEVRIDDLRSNEFDILELEID